VTVGTPYRRWAEFRSRGFGVDQRIEGDGLVGLYLPPLANHGLLLAHS
jgi:hypothetical protein